jgi:hypothetical protein
MRKWKLMLASALALIVLTLVPLAVMAQAPTATNAVTPAAIKPDLVIVAPRAVLAGANMQLTVFKRDDQTPVAGVDIWAVTTNRIEAFKKNISGLQKDNSAAPAVSSNSTGIAKYGEKLGATDANGRLTHAFADGGNYLLVAVKDGFRLDFASLIVRGMPKGLAISNPNSIKLGDKVTITVHQKGGDVPVAGVGVWAISGDRASDLKGLMSNAENAAKNNPKITDYAAALTGRAISLGNTDANGQIKDYTFAKAGRYILVAFKSGDGPAFGSIVVMGPTPTPSVTPGARTGPTPTGTVKPDPRTVPTLPRTGNDNKNK